MTIEKPELNDDQSDLETTFYNFDELQNVQLAKLKERVKKVQEAKSRIEGIIMWHDSVNTTDPQIVKENEQIIKTETPLILAEIDGLFDLLIEDIKRTGGIKFKYGDTDQTEEILKRISKIRAKAENGEVSDRQEITRTNDLRTKVFELIDMILELKKPVQS